VRSFLGNNIGSGFCRSVLPSPPLITRLFLLKPDPISCIIINIISIDKYLIAKETSSMGNQENNFPDLMTEKELIDYLRIPEISQSKDHHNVVLNLKRMRDLPRLHICHKVLYPLKAIRDWVEKQTTTGK
jgi:hypothetical protein